MAERDAFRPQLDFPDLVAELITQLRLRGQVGLLNFSDQVIPAFLIGSRGINFAGDLPSFNSPSAFSGATVTPGAGAVVVDTGALPEGTYDFFATMTVTGTVATGVASHALQHRDAANAATLAGLINIITDTVNRTVTVTLPLIGYEIGLNERLRVVSGAAMNTGSITANMYVRIRPTP